MKLRAELKPSLCPFSPNLFPGGCQELPLTLPLKLSTRFIVTTSYSRLVFKQFWKVNLKREFIFVDVLLQQGFKSSPSNSRHFFICCFFTAAGMWLLSKDYQGEGSRPLCCTILSASRSALPCGIGETVFLDWWLASKMTSLLSS